MKVWYEAGGWTALHAQVRGLRRSTEVPGAASAVVLIQWSGNFTPARLDPITPSAYLGSLIITLQARGTNQSQMCFKALEIFNSNGFRFLIYSPAHDEPKQPPFVVYVQSSLLQKQT